MLVSFHPLSLSPSPLSLSVVAGQIVRRYLFLYIPPGFWPRLVARLITFPKRTLPHYVKVSVCWGKYIKFTQ